MPYLKLKKVVVADDNMQVTVGKAEAAIVGLGSNAESTSGTEGISYAGQGGTAVNLEYGFAIAGEGGVARGGAESFAYAFDGGSTSVGDGGVAWSRRGGTASAGAGAFALALDSSSTAGGNSTAYTLSQNPATSSARSGIGGVSIVRTHPVPADAREPATAIADVGGVAIAFGDNYVQGAVGSLLIIVGISAAGSPKFSVGRVGEGGIAPNARYTVNSNGLLVPV